jgi:hypothetical protein
MVSADIFVVDAVTKKWGPAALQDYAAKQVIPPDGDVCKYQEMWQALIGR